MESCTGGAVASILSDVAGASGYLRGGLVTYQTQEKVNAGVAPEVIEEFGVISAETARAMAEAVRERMGAGFGVGITGVLGPEGQDGVAPGTVHVCVVGPAGVQATTMTMNQGRVMVKRRAVNTALLLIRRALLTG